jgi:hypothetical protein
LGSYSAVCSHAASEAVQNYRNSWDRDQGDEHRPVRPRRAVTLREADGKLRDPAIHLRQLEPNPGMGHSGQRKGEKRLRRSAGRDPRARGPRQWNPNLGRERGQCVNLGRRTYFTA